MDATAGDRSAERARRTAGPGGFRPARPLRLDSGATLAPLEIAYKTYGRLNADAVQRRPGLPRPDRRPARWPRPIRSPASPAGGPQWSAPGLPLDPERYFIICTNVVGGCMGSTGPASINPKTGEPYGLAFPVITIADMVRAQAMLIEALGIETLFAVVGGSMGGMQVLQWAADYPEKLFSAVCIAAAAAPLGPEHRLPRGRPPGDHGRSRLARRRLRDGRACGRRRAWRWPAWPRTSPTCRRPALQRKFGRELQRDGLSWGFDADFQVESYLRHQGASFVDRFDANSYLYITRALDYFDLAAQHGGVLAEAFRKARDVRFCVLSFSSDWLYPTAESRDIVRALNAAGCRASFVEIETDKGHDAFFLDEPQLDATLRGFFAAAGPGARALT